jgi:hypothetical protein
MRSGWKTQLGAAAVASLFVLALVESSSTRGDEPGLLRRLLRLPGNGSSSTPSPAAPADAEPPVRSVGALPMGTPVADPTAFGPTVIAPATTGAPAGSASPRLVPRPRVSRSVTDADPVATRITLGRSDDGQQFGMFLQVYADGTVVDSEGAHSLGRDAIKGVLETLESGELFRLHGHCGSPPTDFIEDVQMIVYERSFGRLRATSFSFSGNPQGCDHAVRRLQTLLDAIQARISRPAGAASPIPAPLGGAAGIGPTPISVTPAATSSGPTIRLNEDPAGH